MAVLMPDQCLLDAVLATVAYADMFDFPLRRQEIQRDLIGLAAPAASTTNAIDTLLDRDRLAADGSYLVLPGRRGLAKLRQSREAQAARLWPIAQRFGRLIARFPFVRLVAVTGSLAAGNPDDRADVDYLIVTAPGRLWSVRAMAALPVRLARRAGVHLCPNYLLTTRALALEHKDLFTAHELLLATPLAGAPTYRQFLGYNNWAARWLPNHYEQRRHLALKLPTGGVLQPWSERLLAGRLSGRFEQWEAQRKQRLMLRSSDGNFSEDICEGYLGQRRQRKLIEFEQRCRQLGIVPPGVYDFDRGQREPGALRPVLLPAL